MERIAKFEKISLDRWTKDFHFVNKESVYNNIKMPTRSTAGSAGYDFKAPFSFTLEPGSTVTIPTGIRCKMEPGWVLMLFPRSGLGFKYRMMLSNSVGIIDSDYYGSDNEGHIMAKVYNGGKEPFCVSAGDGFMQGVFVKFGITEDDSADGVRNGGFGSTGK